MMILSRQWCTVLLWVSCVGCAWSEPQPPPAHNCPADEPLLVVVPDVLMGLTNQVLTAMNGIFLGIKTRRNICLGGFYGHMFSQTDGHAMLKGKIPGPRLIHANHVLNLSNMNHVFMAELGGLKICSCSLRDVSCLITSGNLVGGFCKLQRSMFKELNVTDVRIPDKKVAGAIMKPEAQHTKRLVVGCPWHLFSDDYELNKRNERGPYLAKIKFRRRFYDIVSHHLRSDLFGLAADHRPTALNYTVVHLRVEDDIIKDRYLFRLFNDIQYYYYLYQYVLFIRKVVPDSNERIVVQTGLRSTDTLHFAIAYLRHYFPNVYTLDKEKLSSRLHDPVLAAKPPIEGSVSQIDAIFDLVTVEEATRFIGLGRSTYSVWLHNVKQLGNCSSYLFDFDNPKMSDAALAKFRSSEYVLMTKLANAAS